MDVPSQTVKVVPVGDPAISNASIGLPTGFIAGRIKDGRDGVLSKLSLQVFNDVRNQLLSTLRSFDNFADVKYATIEITPDGIILRGAIGPSGAGWRLDPVMHFDVAVDGKSISAFNSWIPGGRIDAFRWTWPVGGSAGAVVSVKVGHNSDRMLSIVSFSLRLLTSLPPVESALTSKAPESRQTELKKPGITAARPVSPGGRSRFSPHPTVLLTCWIRSGIHQSWTKSNLSILSWTTLLPVMLASWDNPRQLAVLPLTR